MSELNLSGNPLGLAGAKAVAQVGIQADRVIEFKPLDASPLLKCSKCNVAEASGMNLYRLQL
jgi:hypothetical protein